MSELVGNDLGVLTCVQDSRETGGGVAGVSLQVHQGLVRKGLDANFLGGVYSGALSSLQFDARSNGSGIRNFPLSKNAQYVVHVHGLWTPFVWRAYRFARKNKLPLVFSPHGMLEPWAMNHKALKKKTAWFLYQKRILNRADMLVVNSNKELVTVRAMGLTPPVAVIENGVDVADLDQSSGSDFSEKVVLFLSRLSPVKGVPDLIEAWSLLPAGHGYELRLYGHADPGYEAELRRLIHEFKVEGSVRLFGPVFGQDKWRAYQGASFFVLPSYSENFGIVVAEALWSGVPVITTNATPWECLAREGIGWQVDNDPRQLRDALLAALRIEDEERKEMALRASVYAKENFNWSNVVDKYIVAYQWLVGGGAQKPKWIDGWKR